jgi:hypothetical protein
VYNATVLLLGNSCGSAWQLVRAVPAPTPPLKAAILNVTSDFDQVGRGRACRVTAAEHFRGEPAVAQLGGNLLHRAAITCSLTGEECRGIPPLCT